MSVSAPKLLLDSLPEEWDVNDAPAYRRKQICQWIFGKRASSFDEMTNLSAPLRAHLREKYSLASLEKVRVQGSRDTTQKYLWKLRSGDFIETVSIPASPALYGEASDRHTLCLSTQVGCAYGCRFCASGLEGWRRNLSPAEIVAQILEVERHSGRKVHNLVFMGMGEPLSNYKNLMAALEIIHAPWGLNLGARHITVSTSGLAPMIRKLADQPLNIRLAISLHGATDPTRDQIMPVNEKYPIRELMDACAYFVGQKQKMITLEYILIKGVNDMPEEAEILARHARRLHAKVNLIPYNTVEGLDWVRPSESVIGRFQSIVQSLGVTATVRREKGHDIDAACGQLRLKEMRKSAAEAPSKSP